MPRETTEKTDTHRCSTVKSWRNTAFMEDSLLSNDESRSSWSLSNEVVETTDSEQNETKVEIEALEHHYNTALVLMEALFDRLIGADIGEEDLEEFKLLEKEANRGNPHAESFCGICCEFGWGTVGDALTSVRWYWRAAQLRVFTFWTNIENIQHTNKEVEEEISEILEEIKKKALAGDADAEHMLARNYYNGIGTPKDSKLAFEWYNKSASQGNTYGMNGIGLCQCFDDAYSDMREAGFDWLLKAAQLGNSFACVNVGDCYEEGIVVESNIDSAIEWFTRGLELHDSYCEYYMAYNYYYGFKIAQDYELAARCARLSALKGNNAALCLLAMMYEEGHGVIADEDIRFRLLKLSANTGYAEAEVECGRRCYDSSAEGNHDEAFYWFEKAAEEDYPEALYLLGICYEHGIGTKSDDRKSYLCVHKAANLGNDEAKQLLEAHHEQMRAAPLLEVELLITAANLGNVECINLLSEYCFEACEVTEDATEMVEIFCRAASTEVVSAEYSMGIAYYRGISVLRNINEAKRWFEIAAKEGHTMAKLHVTLIENNEFAVIEHDLRRIYRLLLDEPLLLFEQLTPEIRSFIELMYVSNVASWSHERELEMLVLSSCYWNGCCVEKNLNMALEILFFLESSGFSKAVILIVDCCIYEPSLLIDNIVSVEWIIHTANRRNSVALTLIGSCYQEGVRVPKLPHKAFEYFRRAAFRGLNEAERILASFYEMGYGTKENSYLAKEWYREAALHGDEEAKAKLEEISKYKRKNWHKQDRKPRNCGISFEARTGDAESEYQMGLRSLSYYKEAPNYKDAVFWFSKAANEGHVSAMVELGVCKLEGRGIEINECDAITIFEKAATLENAKGEYWYGKCLEEGTLISQDLANAIIEFENSAEQGYIPAINQLGCCYRDGIGVEVDSNMAFNYFLKLDGIIHPEYIENLIDCYENGIGADKNELKAIALSLERQLEADDREFITFTTNDKSVENFLESLKNVTAKAEVENRDILLAEYEVAREYLEGDGVLQNFAKAAAIFQKLSLRGNLESMTNLGACFLEGIGVEEDHSAAVLLFNKAADLGCEHAMINLARCLKNGTGTPKDVNRAIQLYKQAASEELASAYLELGRLYTEGRAVETDWEIALGYFKSAAETGDAIGENCYGECFYYGKGVEEDYFSAAMWIQQASEELYVPGVINYAECLLYGRGVEENIQEAMEMFREVAEIGNPMAVGYLGICIIEGCVAEENIDEAIGLLTESINEGCDKFIEPLAEYCAKHGKSIPILKREQEMKMDEIEPLEHEKRETKDEHLYNQGKIRQFWEAAKTGDPIAERHLGLLFESSNDGSNAVYWLKKAVAQGDTLSMFELGMLYFKGQFLEMDLKKAIELFEEAADESEAGLEIALGNEYKNGFNGKPDYKKAIYWYERACKNGSSEAFTCVAYCYENGLGVEKDEFKAFELYCKAESTEELDTLCELAEMYLEGRGTEENVGRGIELLRKAVDKGYATAEYQLGVCYETGHGVDPDLVAALYHYQTAADSKYGPAITKVGECYEQGRGVAENLEMAVKYYRKAYEEKDEEGTAHLARCYWDGIGVGKDIKRSYRYSSLLDENMIKQTFEETIYDLRFNKERKIERIRRKNAQEGRALDQFALSKNYREGTFDYENLARAQFWLRLSVTQGHQEAIEIMANEAHE